MVEKDKPAERELKLREKQNWVLKGKLEQIKEELKMLSAIMEQEIQEIKQINKDTDEFLNRVRP